MTIEEILAARARLVATVAVTPGASSETLSVTTASRVFVKLENLQISSAISARRGTSSRK